jgi:neutral trehalase
MELPEELTAKIAKSRLTLEQLWDGYSNQYYSRNQVTNKLIRVPSIATLLPLYAGCITPERAEQLVALLQDDKLFGAAFPIPSVPLNSKHFDQFRYWQGPTWINTNWLIVQGLERYGYKAEAALLRRKSLQLVEEHGFYEYFSPLDGTPAGAKNFSWTAALAIDLSAT